jgi:hypothetical protein
MTWWEAEPRARLGVLVRRRAWADSLALATSAITYVAGAGSTRAVAVRRVAGMSDTVVSADVVTAADLAADDWEDVS